MEKSDDRELRELAVSDGWAAAKQPIVREIVSLLDISNLPLGDANALAIEVAARQVAAKILQGFLNRVEAAKVESTDTYNREMEIEVSSFVRTIG